MNNLFQNFIGFMNQMKGQEPTAILNNLMQSGKISQAQLNAAQQQAAQMSQQLAGLKSMFGFR